MGAGPRSFVPDLRRLVARGHRGGTGKRGGYVICLESDIVIRPG
jgi:hypothetical protein